ncbi:MAG: adenylate kinase [Pirellulales bacterium]|nr:adenylate kinase [Pirellulales bacterium]
MRIVFLGPPGAGKGTQAVRLAEYLGVPHLSTGEMFRMAAERKTSIGLLAQEYFSTGRLVPDEVVIGVVQERLSDPDCSGGYLLDGFPRTLAQAKALDAILDQKETPLDRVIELTVAEEILIQRMLARGRADDTRQAVAKRFEEYAMQTKPLSEYYLERGWLVTVNGEGTPDEVFDRVKRTVGF